MPVFLNFILADPGLERIYGKGNSISSNHIKSQTDRRIEELLDRVKSLSGDIIKEETSQSGQVITYLTVQLYSFYLQCK